MVEFLAFIIIALFVYYIVTSIVKGGKNVANTAKAKNDMAKNIGNPEWEQHHRAEAMKYYWTNNNSPINLGIRLGHMTTIVYPYTPQMSTLAVPDSAGGWDMQVTITNKSDKTIKYVKIPFTPYNPVGDVAYSSIGGQSTVVTNFTGPIQPKAATTFNVDKPWYNINLGWIETGTIEITFMDGTHYTWASLPNANKVSQKPATQSAPSSKPATSHSTDSKVSAKGRYKVIMTKCGTPKGLVNYDIRTLTGLTFDEVTELLEHSPAIIAQGVSQSRSELIQTTLEARGCKIEIEIMKNDNDDLDSFMSRIRDLDKLDAIMYVNELLESGTINNDQYVALYDSIER